MITAKDAKALVKGHLAERKDEFKAYQDATRRKLKELVAFKIEMAAKNGCNCIEFSTTSELKHVEITKIFKPLPDEIADIVQELKTHLLTLGFTVRLSWDFLIISWE